MTAAKNGLVRGALADGSTAMIGIFSRETFSKPLNFLRIDGGAARPYIAAHDDDAHLFIPPPPCPRGTGTRSRVIVSCRRTLAPRHFHSPKFAVPVPPAAPG